MRIVAIIFSLSFFISQFANALDCSDKDWSDCKDSVECLTQSSNASCAFYAKKYLSCKPCQHYDNEADTKACFIKSGC